MMPAGMPEGNLPRQEVGPTEVPLQPAPHRSPAPWSLWDLGFFLAYGALALLFSNLVVLAGYSLLQPVMGWHTPSRALRENPFFLLTLQTVFHGLVLGYVYLLVVANYRQPFWAALQWRNPTAHETVRFVLGGLLLAVAVRLAPTLLPEREDFPLQRLFSSPAAAYAVTAFAVLIAPFMEELIFRGVLFSIFERQVGIRFAVVSTAVLFAGLHVQEYWGAWNHVLLILLVGMVFSLARGLTGSLAPSVILHLAYNAALMAGLFFETRHFRALPGMFVP